MNIETIRSGFRYLQKHGAKILWIRLQEKRQQGKTEYRKEFLDAEKDHKRLEEQRHDAGQWSKRPLLSIVTPLYNTPEKFLRDMIESVMDSSYENWQLCLVDATPGETAIERIVREYQDRDRRICYKKLPQNLGIAENTNQALAMAEGDYIAFLDHDDVITPDAVYEMMKAAREAEAAGKEAELLYSDEDKTNEDRTSYFEPHFKPDFNLDLLRANNYITHFLVVKKTLLDRVGGIRKEFDGAQDYDFILRCTEEAKRIVHVPKVLYHWRVHSLSTSRGGGSKDYAINAGKKAIEAHLERMGVDGAAEATPYFGFYHVNYKVPEYEVVDRFQIAMEQQKLQESRVVEIVRVNEQDYVLIYDPAFKPDSRNWKDILIADCNGTSAGVVGGKIYDRHNRILEAQYNIVSREIQYGASPQKTQYGIIPEKLQDSIKPTEVEKNNIEINTNEKEWEAQKRNTITNTSVKIQNTFAGLKRGYGGYMHRANLQMDCDAVSGRCMIVRKEILEEFSNYEKCLAEPDFSFQICEKAREKGLMVMYEPTVIMKFL